jgi:RNA polymerase sigma factor (sigma-70 family)
MKKEKDIILIRGIKVGDKKAERKLYEKYKEKIEKYLFIKYPNDIDKEDNVSEILIKIFENINKYDKKRAKFQTWVINIAKNYMIDKARKNKQNPVQANYTSMDGSLSLCSAMGYSTGTDITKSFQPQSFTIQPDQELENKDALSFISNKIGLQDFHLLNMKYKEGYDYKEMESEMKVSSSTISNRINYVKSKLKRNKGE